MHVAAVFYLLCSYGMMTVIVFIHSVHTYCICTYTVQYMCELSDQSIIPLLRRLTGYEPQYKARYLATCTQSAIEANMKTYCDSYAFQIFIMNPNWIHF